MVYHELVSTGRVYLSKARFGGTGLVGVHELVKVWHQKQGHCLFKGAPPWPHEPRQGLASGATCSLSPGTPTRTNLASQVCPVEGQWVQAILPRLEGIDVNRLR